MSDSQSKRDELLLVVDVSSFTDDGFVGSSEFEGKRVDIEFDDEDNGLTLSKEMCARTATRAGSKVLIFVEDDTKIQSFESKVRAVSSQPRFSNSKLYYFMGAKGGAIIRMRKA